MARYTGPRSKVSRRFGMPIFGTSKALERRAFPPGVHGAKGRRKLSEYAVALGEKQKLKMTYGLLEKQFRRYFEIALRKRGDTGEMLLQLLETRLDNIAYLCGFATSRRQARQLVGHGHILLNGKTCSTASTICKAGDTVEIHAHAKSRQMAERALELSQIRQVPGWLSLDKPSLKATIARIPSREDIAPVVNERLVVELYSR